MKMETTKYLVAATLAIGGLNFCSIVSADDTQTQTTETQTTTTDNNATVTSNTDNSMSGVKDTHYVNNVREQLREITNAALTKNDLEAIRNRLTVADQDRLGNLGKMDSDDLNMVIKDIDQKWKDKYNHSFDINTKMALAEPFVRIDSINKAQVASNADGTKQEDREVANATVAEDKDNKTPELNLTLVREHMSWKLQLPSSIDGATLKTNLMAQLQAINNDAANWPADENEAYRCVSHRILMGITGATGPNAQPASSNGM
jgi:hypothetical protein